jgi:hypothetical protein
MKVILELTQSKTGAYRLEQKNHGELGMDDRLFDIDDVQTFFEDQLGYLRDNPDLVFSDHRDNVEIFLFGDGLS